MIFSSSSRSRSNIQFSSNIFQNNPNFSLKSNLPKYSFATNQSNPMELPRLLCTPSSWMFSSCSQHLTSSSPLSLISKFLSKLWDFYRKHSCFLPQQKLGHNLWCISYTTYYIHYPILYFLPSNDYHYQWPYMDLVSRTSYISFVICIQLHELDFSCIK